MPLTGTVTEVVAAPPGEVFGVITDIDRLPEWNDIIEALVERPPALVPDAEWVVRLRSMGMRWESRARLLELDEAARRFGYRSRTDDGNPSFAIWRWAVDDDPAGARVTVSWELHPETFWRQVLLGRVRNRQLRTEVSHSVDAAARAAVGGTA